MNVFFTVPKVWILFGYFLDIFWIVMETQQTRELYHFGAFRLDAAERRLWCDDEPISLTPKEFELLFYFVENAGSVAKKDELLDAVWADSFVEESTLARNISWLRKKLGKGADGKRVIETVSKTRLSFYGGSYTLRL